MQKSKLMCCLKVAKRVFSCGVLLLLAACSVWSDFPNYTKNTKLQPNEAVGVFRVINAGNTKHNRRDVGFIITKDDAWKRICLVSNGFIDDANSSRIDVKRLTPGTYSLWGIVSGNYQYIFVQSQRFDVHPGEVFYLGDIIFSAGAQRAFLIDNRIAVRRQLRRLYPELEEKDSVLKAAEEKI